METLKTAVIGIGNIGSVHANCIYGGEIEGLTLVAVCDVNTEKLEKFREKYSGVETFTDYKQLITSGKLDAVIVSVPHPMHSEIASFALENGLHVLVEKPIDIAVSVAKKLIQIAEKSNKVFAIMFNQRTNPLFIKAKEIFESGLLGELKRTVWVVTNWYRTQYYYNSGNWRATWAGEGGGVLLNQAPHNLDIWQWICGMPSEVTAFCDVGKYHDVEVEDDATIVTRYENGAMGTFITSTGECPGTNRLEISGSKGKIIIENGVLKWWRLKEDERDFCFNSSESFPNVQCDYEEILPEKEETAHKGILQNFANAIIKGETLISKGSDGIKELSISNAAYLSSWLGNVPIKLPFDEEKFDALLNEHREASAFKNGEVKRKLNTQYSRRWQVNW